MSTVDIRKLYAEIQTHPGKQAYDRWSNLKLTYQGIYQANRKQLLGLMDAPNHSEELLVELIQNVRPQTVREKYEYELLKTFHNYIASSSTLVDHSRRFIKQYSDDTAFKNEYDRRKDVVGATMEHCFLKDVRNYIVHCDIPPLGWVVSISKNDDEHLESFFNSDKLKEWNKWSSKAKEFLDQSDKQLHIAPIIAVHGKMIDDFYEWIFAQFELLHGEEIEAVNRLIEQSNPNLLEKDLP